MSNDLDRLFDMGEQLHRLESLLAQERDLLFLEENTSAFVMGKLSNGQWSVCYWTVGGKHFRNFIRTMRREALNAAVESLSAGIEVEDHASDPVMRMDLAQMLDEITLSQKSKK